MSTVDDEVECPRCGKWAYESFDCRSGEHYAFCIGSGNFVPLGSNKVTVLDKCEFGFDQWIINRDELTDRRTRPIYATHAEDLDGTPVTIIWRMKPIEYAFPPIKPVDSTTEKGEPAVNKNGSHIIQLTDDEMRHAKELAARSDLINQEPDLMFKLLFASPPTDILPEIRATFDVIRVILNCRHLKVMPNELERVRTGYRCVDCCTTMDTPPLSRSCGHGNFTSLRDGMALYCTDCGVALWEEPEDPFSTKWSAHCLTIGDKTYLSLADESTIVPALVHRALHAAFDGIEEYAASGSIDFPLQRRFSYYHVEKRDMR